MKKTTYLPLIGLGIILMIGIILLIFKDSLLFHHYVSKGDKETVKAVQISEYAKAYELKKDTAVMEKMLQILKDMENFEDKMLLIIPMLSEQEMDSIYQDVYESKATAQFDKKNYKSAMDLLKKGEKYGYEITQFENFKDLQTALKPPAPKKEKEQEKEESSPKKSETTTVIIVPTNPDTGEKYYNLNWKDEYLMPQSSYQYLSVSDLAGYSKGELAYIRNEIFARHGYIFQKAQYRNYFNQKSWYYPNSSFKGNMNELSSIERANVELIKRME